ncbi:glycosyltransferase family 2 protein [Bradyrhizobium sp. JYMT SZCCT0428]|uniref:glycosyltransferase family 2 protein n=1 Tax=Bradyrhizobium sp. JYMT SZCCT0428 TaxID=2807673 RepID=UPI001BA500A8|nr:glycosyltransferase family 2 protein [Bradyrhizobium sp. JYMT SZCCT0428]MBR1151578.1 glycosyltransferase family 2 protein [Bradyrhizobium sp. JYMT SZCCT0428]
MVRSLHPLCDELVSIVVPAFNAAATIRETIVSALNQTHHNIEIIVVDDGSTDRTKDVVASIVRSDERVRYHYKPNGGVASARNLGIAEAKGAFIATLDADDLWYPTKVARQLERFQASGPETALVYAWCCWIDDHGGVIGYAPPTRLEGNILPQMCLGNVVISGSNALIKREALLAAGGFDETLRTRGGQGCEDWKLYVQIAAWHQIAMVPEYLVGYRVSPVSMSDDFQQMMRSRRLVEAEFISVYPNLAPHLARGKVILARSLALRAFERRQFRSAIDLLTDQPEGRLASGMASVFWLLGGLLRRLVRHVRVGPRTMPTEFLQKEKGLGSQAPR